LKIKIRNEKNILKNYEQKRRSKIKIEEKYNVYQKIKLAFISFKNNPKYICCFIFQFIVFQQFLFCSIKFNEELILGKFKENSIT
jgi:hypothetical protein